MKYKARQPKRERVKTWSQIRNQIDRIQRNIDNDSYWKNGSRGTVLTSKGFQSFNISRNNAQERLDRAVNSVIRGIGNVTDTGTNSYLPSHQKIDGNKRYVTNKKTVDWRGKVVNTIDLASPGSQTSEFNKQSKPTIMSKGVVAG